MKAEVRACLALGLLCGALLGAAVSVEQQGNGAVAATHSDDGLAPGQTTTLLSDGSWLIVGGERSGGPTRDTFVRRADGELVPLGARLRHPRTWHTATALPDGSVLIAGGFGHGGRLVDDPEVFDPQGLDFRSPVASGVTPRALHSATLLTDGRILVVGGVGPSGGLPPEAELWTLDGDAIHPSPMAAGSGRLGHTATLLASGEVLLVGGFDENGSPLTDGMLFDPTTGAWNAVDPSAILSTPGGPAIVGSMPADGAQEVPVDSRGAHVRARLQSAHEHQGSPWAHDDVHVQWPRSPPRGAGSS